MTLWIYSSVSGCLIIPPSSSAGGGWCVKHTERCRILLFQVLQTWKRFLFLYFEALTEQMSLVLACDFFLETKCMFLHLVAPCSLAEGETSHPESSSAPRFSGDSEIGSEKNMTIVYTTLHCYENKFRELNVWSGPIDMSLVEFDGFVRVRN